jgi:beta-galactosidase/beta-glucuronidase
VLVFSGFNSLYGGIIRNVFLHVVPEVYATFPLYTFLKTEGTYVYAENISTEKRTADIGIEVQVRNDGAKARKTTCQAVLVDREGRQVASFQAKPQQVNPGANGIFKLGGQVGDLHFWQPGHPYLYDVYTIVGTGQGEPDVRKITTGFRKIEVRGAEFFLNNRPLMTHGYTRAARTNGPLWAPPIPTGSMIFRTATWSRAMPDSCVGNTRCPRRRMSPRAIASASRRSCRGADRENDSVGREWEMRVEIMRDTIIYCRNNPSIILWEAANNVLTQAHPGNDRPARQVGPAWL